MVVAWPPVERDIEVRRCGGGRVPRAADEEIVYMRATLPESRAYFW